MFFADAKNESYMKIKRKILSSRRASVRTESPSASLLFQNGKEDIEMMQRELEHLRRKCSELSGEKTSIRLFIGLIMILIDNVIFLF